MSFKPEYIIFTDGSVRKVGKVSYAGYGCAVVDVKHQAYEAFSGSLNSGSIVYCEAFAIYQGLRWIRRLLSRTHKNHAKVLLVSDSRLNVQILTEWIPEKWDLSDYRDWKTSSNKPVQNQVLYRKILALLEDQKIKLGVIHINSHLKSNIETVMKIQRKAELSCVKLSEPVTRMMIEMNQKVDELASHESKRMQMMYETHQVGIRLKRKELPS